MVASLSHESIYRSSSWCDDSIGAYVASVEIKDSFSDGMPLRSKGGNIVLLFSGEDFSDTGIGHTVDAHGTNGRAAASYLADMAENNPKFLSAINGTFHGFVGDLRSGAASLFNDRFGLHRLYVHEAEDAFYFAAEAKAILAVRPELRRIDPRAMGELITCGCVLEDRTLFPDIQVLPPASVWTWRNGSLAGKAHYFRPEEWEQQQTLDAETYYQQLKSVFARAVKRYLRSFQPLAVSLTAGLDTRAILAWAAPAPNSLPCYTFGGIYRDSLDVIVARQVAQQLKQPYQVIRVDQEFLDQFPRYAERAIYITDGSASVSRASNLYVNEKARAIAPVRLTGNFGGEVLRRVRLFKPEMPAPGVFSKDLMEEAKKAKETFSQLLCGVPLSFTLFREMPWHHHGLAALESTQVTVRSPYLDNDFVATAYRAPQELSSDTKLTLRLIADGNKELLRIRTDFGYAGKDNLAGAVSRRVRLFSHKAEYAYDYGMPQWAVPFDRFLSPFHPERLFLGRHKYFHYRVWYRDVLCDYLKQMLLDSRSLSRPYVDRQGVERMVRDHCRGVRNHTTAIHQVLSLELIHRLFIDSTANFSN
jgi:asparagine synthase (glutamine-hydrolysing)